MKLLSCDECGVVIDQDVFIFDRENFYEEDGSIKDGVAVWNSDHYVAAIACRVCGNIIASDFKV